MPLLTDVHELVAAVGEEAPQVVHCQLIEV